MTSSESCLDNGDFLRVVAVEIEPEALEDVEPDDEDSADELEGVRVRLMV